MRHLVIPPRRHHQVPTTKAGPRPGGPPPGQPQPGQPQPGGPQTAGPQPGEPEGILILARSSFARYVADWLLDAAAEYLAAGHRAATGQEAVP